MSSLKHIAFFSFILLNCYNCSSGSMSTNQGQVSQPDGRGTISTNCLSAVSYDNRFALNVEFKQDNTLQSSISFSNILQTSDNHTELIEDWLIGADSLPFSRLLEYVGGDVILQSYRSAPNSYIEVIDNDGQIKISFDTLLFLKDLRFQNASQASDSIFLVDGLFEFSLES
jgi:hypothetical protein